MRRANPDDVKLCTTYLDKHHYYDNYARSGIQNYILTPDSLYLFFVKTRHHSPQATEFADYKNMHDFAPLFQMKDNNNITVLAKPMIDNYPLKVTLLNMNKEEGYQLLTDWVISKHSFEGMEMCWWVFHKYEFAKLLTTTLIEVYDHIPDNMEKLIRQEFDKSITNQLIKHGLLPSNNSDPDDYPEFEYDVNIIFRENFNNQLISTREQLFPVLSEMWRDLTKQLDKYNTKRSKITGESIIELHTEFVENTIGGGNPDVVTQVDQLIADDFPTFTDPHDVKNWFNNSNVDMDVETVEIIVQNFEIFISYDDCLRIGINEMYQCIIEDGYYN